MTDTKYIVVQESDHFGDEGITDSDFSICAMFETQAEAEQYVSENEQSTADLYIDGCFHDLIIHRLEAGVDYRNTELETEVYPDED